MPSASEYLGALTGSGGRGAARDAAAAQEAGMREGITTLQAGGVEAQQFLDPYQTGGLGAFNKALDYLGGREFTADPYAQQQIDRGLEAVNRNTMYLGQGGGARAKRLMNEAMLGANQFRQQEIQNLQAFGGMGQNAATNQAGIAQNTAGGIANLQGGIGDVNAAGIIGAQNAVGQGLGNMIQLGMMGVGGGMGGAGMAMLGGLGGGGNGAVEDYTYSYDQGGRTTPLKDL